jgi:orotidine-5'-phosphate decarboxylase
MIIVAIDETNFNSAKNIIDFLDPNKCMIKIGSVSFNSVGQKLLKYTSDKGFEIFLDLKLHDIPNTVKKTIQGLTSLPIAMLTVHSSGGKDMMMSAMEGVIGTDIKVFAVTALTSLSDDDTYQIYKRNCVEQVNAMIDLAMLAGVDGVVCSPHELEIVKRKTSLLTITPGIRLNDSIDDQKRVMTPQDAISLGADYIVIGRPITASNSIADSLAQIYESIK